MKQLLVLSLLTLTGLSAMLSAGTLPPERITVSGNEFRVCNNTQRIWMGGANTPWFLWNDFGNAAFNVNTWDSHYATLIANKVNSSRVWITCNGEVGINISAAGVVGSGTPGSGATAKHWADLDAFFAMAQTRKIYVKATLMSFDHFKDTYSTYQRWRNWINNTSNVESYIDTYLLEFLNRYGSNPYLWSIDLINEPEWASNTDGGTIDWARFQYAWGRMARYIHDWNDNNGGNGPLVTVGMGYVKHLSDRAGGSNKVSDAILSSPANGNSPKARLDYWDAHYYLWQEPWVGNPFTQTPNTFFNATLDRPAMLGENPNDGGSDSDPPSSVDGPRTLLNDINDAYANGWQGFAPWTSNNAGSGNFGDWDNDLNDATVPFDAAHPGLLFPGCAVNTPTRTVTRTSTLTATRTRTPSPSPSPTPGPAYLKTYADPCGINVGTAVVWSAFNAGPGPYRTTLENNFNLVEPENEMKWGEIRPNQATFNYTKSDALIAWAQPRGMKIRGHVLAWHQDNPAWLTGGGFNAAQMSNHLQTHINTVMAHFAGKVYAWDVVNEAFNEDGTLRTSVWHGAPGIGITGTGWIEQAFRWARAADPNAKLYYNDYNNELAGYAKADAVYAMAQDFVARGVPIDGIGMQMHIVAGSGWPNPAGVRTQINRITALGLDVEITELDVRIQSPTDATKLASQAATTQAIVDACLDNPRCKTIQWWGHTDNYSWIPGTFPGYDDGLLLDRSYNPKPVYNTFLAELNRPCLATPSSTRTPTQYAGTPTFTPTPSPAPSTQLYDDFEDLNTANNWGGNWQSYAGTGSSLTLTVGAGGAPGSTLGRAALTGTVADYAGLSGSFSGSPRDLTGYVGIQFMVRGSGTYWWQVVTAGVADGDHFGAAFTATGAWTQVTLWFSALDQRGFGAATTLDLAQSQMFQWASNANGAFNLEIDDVRLLTYQLPTATPSATRSPTATLSRSPTPSATRTASSTMTGSPTRSASPTASRTGSASSTTTPTGTLTAGSSATPTSTATRTASASPSASATRTRTLSASPTSTAFMSATPTFTVAVGSPTTSPTQTQLVPSATLTATVPIATATETSVLPSATLTATNPAATPTETSVLPSATLTATNPAPTATETSAALSATPTLSPPVGMPSGTQTRTASATFSPSATATLSASPTSTWSVTDSPTPTLSATPSPLVLSATPSATPTPTGPAATAVPTPGPLLIVAAVPFPNPKPQFILIKMDSAAERVTLKVYTPAWVAIGSTEQGPQPAGWSRLALPPQLAQAPRGLYYFVVQAHEGGRKSKPKQGRFYWL